MRGPTSLLSTPRMLKAYYTTLPLIQTMCEDLLSTPCMLKAYRTTLPLIQTIQHAKSVPYDPAANTNNTNCIVCISGRVVRYAFSMCGVERRNQGDLFVLAAGSYGTLLACAVLKEGREMTGWYHVSQLLGWTDFSFFRIEE